MKTKVKNKICDYAIILIFAIIISIPMLNNNFNIYIDDGIQHIARLMGTMQSIEEGQVFPVIMSNFCNGFGYSWNIFYSPITAYVPLIFHIFTNSFELILKLFIILVSFSSGIAMYEFVNKISKNRYAGLMSAMIYILAPYRITDMYTRIAISELTSFIFLPITFQGMYNIFNKEEGIKKSLLLTLGATGLILTQSVIAMYAALMCFLYLIINIKKLKKIQVLKMLGINILLIILLTSFYTIPLLEHKINSNYEVFKPGRMERTDVLIQNKVDILDLIYTGSSAFSFEIGLVSIIGIVLTILAHKKVDKEIRKIYWFSLITGIICVIMSLRFFPFEKLPAVLKMLQFTFRLLEFSTFFFAIVAGINYTIVIKSFKIRDTIILSIVSILLLMPVYNNFSFGKSWKEETLWNTVRVNENTGRVHAGCATFEYLPSKAFENLDYIKTRENKVYILSGNLNINEEKKDKSSMSFYVSDIKEDTILELPYIYYLGYTIEIKDDVGNIQKIDSFESENGFVAINISDTEYKSGLITVKYTGTDLMKVSYILSFITLVSIIIWLVVSKVKSINTKVNKNNVEVDKIGSNS